MHVALLTPAVSVHNTRCSFTAEGGVCQTRWRGSLEALSLLRQTHTASTCKETMAAQVIPGVVSMVESPTQEAPVPEPTACVIHVRHKCSAAQHATCPLPRTANRRSRLSQFRNKILHLVLHCLSKHHQSKKMPLQLPQGATAVPFHLTKLHLMKGTRVARRRKCGKHGHPLNHSARQL